MGFKQHSLLKHGTACHKGLVGRGSCRGSRKPEFRDWPKQESHVPAGVGEEG